MHAVIGRVQIKPGHADDTLAMIGDPGTSVALGTLDHDPDVRVRAAAAAASARLHAAREGGLA